MLLAILGLVLNVTPAHATQAIIGGQAVDSSDVIAKSTVLLFGEDSKKQEYLCTGTILNSEWILTAAHCVLDTAGMFVFFTTDGSSSDKVQALLDAKSNVRNVVDVKHNADYPTTVRGMNAPHNDIGLVRFEGGLPDGYQPVTLLDPSVSAQYLKPGQAVIIAGFGERTENATSSATDVGTLYKDNVTIDSVAPKTVEVGQSGSSSCNGDSGGPAFVSINGKLYQWGVLSRGDQGCTSSAIYTPLTSNFFGNMEDPANPNPQQ